jgi:hypothetical protein
MGEEAGDELIDPRLGDLGKQIRKLGERRVTLGQTCETSLDAERHLLEAIERQPGERLARRASGLGLFAAEDVDEQVDHPWPLHLSQNLGQALETKRHFVPIVIEGDRIAVCPLECGNDAPGILAREFVPRSPGGALCVKKRFHGGDCVYTCHFRTDNRQRKRLQLSKRIRPMLKWLSWLQTRRGVPGALAVTALLSFGSPRALPRRVESGPIASVVAASPLDRTTCPPGSLPDGEACIRWPDEDDEGAPELESSVNAHRDTLGHWIVYDEIPRRPDRPADYDAYRYPVPCDHACVASGYDLDHADALQRRGRHLRQVGHGAVDLPEARGTAITSIVLEHQQGDAEVIYIGPLFGTTVVTRHTLREGGRLRDYLLIFGHLESTLPDLQRGAHLKEGDGIGFVGDTGSPDLVHLHLESRRVRDGVDASKLAPYALVDGANSVVCDPRNVLPLR